MYSSILILSWHWRSGIRAPGHWDVRHHTDHTLVSVRSHVVFSLPFSGFVFWVEVCIPSMYTKYIGAKRPARTVPFIIWFYHDSFSYLASKFQLTSHGWTVCVLYIYVSIANRNVERSVCRTEALDLTATRAWACLAFARLVNDGEGNPSVKILFIVIHVIWQCCRTYCICIRAQSWIYRDDLSERACLIGWATKVVDDKSITCEGNTKVKVNR